MDDFQLTTTALDPYVNSEMVEFLDPNTGARRRMPLSPLQAGVSIGFAGSFPPRNVIGDANYVKHDWLSQIIQNNWQGGGQRTEADEATTMQRYAGLATLDTRWPELLCLLPETVELVGPNTNGFWPLGDLTSGTVTTYYAAFGNRLCSIDPLTYVVTDLAALTEPPVAHGVVFRGTGTLDLIFIPQSGGYQTWDGTTVSAQVTAFHPVSLCVVNNVLYGVTADATVFENTTGLAADIALVLRIDGGARGHRVVSFRDASGSPLLHVVTDLGLYSIDVGGSNLYETDVTYPKHPSSGLAAVKWRQDLYVAYGDDVISYTLGTVNYVGPVRDHGLPRSYRGAIVSMANGYNVVWCLLKGASTIVETLPTWFWGELWSDDWAFSTDAAYTSLLLMDGYRGWHTGWVGDVQGDPPTEVGTSAAAEQFVCYWGTNGHGYAQAMSREFQNPLNNPSARFMSNGRLTSSWFDNGNPGVQFLLSGMLAYTERCAEGQTIFIEYQLNDETNPWIYLDTITAQSANGFVFYQINDCGTLPDNLRYYRGEFYSKARYRVTLNTDDPTLTPALKAIGFIYMPVQGDLRTFNFRVDCSNDEMDGMDGLTNRERAEFLDGLPQERFIPMAYRGRWHVLKVTGSTGFDATGLDWRGDREIAAIQAYRF